MAPESSTLPVHGQQTVLDQSPRREADAEKGHAEKDDSPSQASSQDEDEAAFSVTWDANQDPESPRCYSTAKKWLIVSIVAASSFCVTVNSSLYTTIYDQVIPEFRTNREIATLGLSTFVLGLMTGPMLLAPLSEFYGRRAVYIGSFVMIFIWIIPCAVANGMATILVTRFLDGFFASAFLSVAGGTIGDMFDKMELSLPMMIYSASPFLGPVMGPMIGGFINEFTNWRWSFWVLLIWTAAQLLVISVLLPETYHPVLLRRRAARMRKETGDDRWKAPIERMQRSLLKTIMWSCIRPFQLLFFEVMVLNLCLLSALLLGILYLFFGAFPLVFQTLYGFSLYQVGLAFMGILVGELVAVILNPIWQVVWKRLQRRYEEQGGKAGGSEPEYRLPSVVAGAPLVTIGLFGFAWTTYPSVHWIVPIIFSGIFGLGNVWCFSGIFTFQVESYPLYAASSLAANSFTRSAFAASFPLFGDQMYNNLGFQWASTLLAFLSLVMMPFPYIFYRYGKRIRRTSRYASA